MRFAEAGTDLFNVAFNLSLFFVAADDPEAALEVVAAAESEACELAQNFAQAVEACRAGCIDVETAYNFRSSQSRGHFGRIRAEALREVKAAGLWISPSSTPRRGTGAFNAACQRYINGGYDGLFAGGASPAGPSLTGTALDGLRRAAASGKLKAAEAD